MLCLFPSDEVSSALLKVVDDSDSLIKVDESIRVSLSLDCPLGLVLSLLEESFRSGEDKHGDGELSGRSR